MKMKTWMSLATWKTSSGGRRAKQPEKGMRKRKRRRRIGNVLRFELLRSMDTILSASAPLSPRPSPRSCIPGKLLLPAGAPRSTLHIHPRLPVFCFWHPSDEWMDDFKDRGILSYCVVGYNQSSSSRIYIFCRCYLPTHIHIYICIRFQISNSYPHQFLFQLSPSHSPLLFFVFRLTFSRYYDPVPFLRHR